MANIQAAFLLLFLLLWDAKADQLERSTNISLGSSIFPNIHPTSWSSPSGLFAFGFYRQGNGYAIGIWLATKPNITIVWTANRNDPPVSSNSTIEFTKDGQLLLRTKQGEEKPIPVRGDDLVVQGATSACLLDSGNLVIYNKSSVMWESFDYPTDTILGGQNLSSDDWLISSASASDQSMGRFYLSMQSDGNLVAYPVNSAGGPDDAYWVSNTLRQVDDVWLNLNRTGYLCIYQSLDFDARNILTVTLATSSSNSFPPDDRNYKSMVICRATLDPDGNFRLYAHRFKAAIDNSSSTVALINEWSAFRDPCEAKGFCGVNSFCNSTVNFTDCFCFPGFVFVDPNQKYRGCYRTFIDEGSCRRTGDVSYSYNITALQNMDWGGYPYSVLYNIIDEEYCGRSCRDDCNCWAALYVSGMCNKHKLPILYGKLNASKSTTAFIKMSTFQTTQSSTVVVPTTSPKVVVESKKTLVLTLAVSFGSLAFLCSLIAVSSFFFYRRRAHRYQKLSDQNAKLGLNGGEFTLRSFSYNELEKATDGFKEVVGRNSLGAVYKGAICEGSRIVAVKRLERVVEGEREFRAEMATVGQTHHRNLVQLIGFCVEGAKKLLVYEFMNNGSLADLLFKIDHRPTWKDRARIALDVARGILYLHEECEVRIIHCNIKPQNILLDESWTAKISDFGLAKLLMPNQTGTLTGVRGARGYLAPEWHKNTFLSEKVDVYSFGVVLLEIICCRRNMEVNVSTADEVLLTTWVYDCFVAKELKRLIGDEQVEMRNLERMVRVGLLCIQDDPNLRPSMKNVLLMLEGTIDIAVPPSPIACLVNVH